ncbi:MAG: hypothetical protein KGL74_02775, partial [Elusimicrobia bacterium]|nr:hypothetical protein [Elusimicrobiota bacterium]
MRRAPRWVVALGLLLASGRAGAVSSDIAALGIDFSTVRAMSLRPPAGAAFSVEAGAFAAPAQAVPLAPILDRVRRGRIFFHSGSTIIHVFGGKSQNKKNWFIGFAVDGGDAQFRNGRKMLHWAFLNRTVHFQIGARKYAAYLEGKAADKMHSRVVVEPEDRSEPKSSWSIQEIADDSYDAGVPVSVGGREFRVLYTRDFNEDDNGEFAGYTGDRSITFMAKEGGKLVGYHWFEREIPADRVLIS